MAEATAPTMEQAPPAAPPQPDTSGETAPAQPAVTGGEPAKPVEDNKGEVAQISEQTQRQNIIKGLIKADFKKEGVTDAQIEKIKNLDEYKKYADETQYPMDRLQEVFGQKQEALAEAEGKDKNVDSYQPTEASLQKQAEASKDPNNPNDVYKEWLKPDGLVEGGLKAQVRGEVYDEMYKATYLHFVQAAEDEVRAQLSKSPDQTADEFEKLVEERVAKQQAEIKEKIRQSLETEVEKRTKEKMATIGSENAEDVLKLLLGEEMPKEGVVSGAGETNSPTYEDKKRKLIETALGWGLNFTEEGLKNSSFERLLQFLFHPESFSRSFGESSLRNAPENPTETVTLEDFKYKLENKKVFGAKLKLAYEDKDGLLAKSFRLEPGNEANKEELLKKMAEGDEEALKNVMHQFLEDIFKGSQEEVNQKWDAARNAFGKSLFPDANKVLGAPVGQFLERLHRNPEEFDHYFTPVTTKKP